MKFNTSPYKDPPETLRQAIENAIVGTTISYAPSFGRQTRNILIDLIQSHVEDFLATEFTKLAYDTDHVKGLINTLKRRILTDEQMRQEELL